MPDKYFQNFIKELMDAFGSVEKPAAPSRGIDMTPEDYFSRYAPQQRYSQPLAWDVTRTPRTRGGAITQLAQYGIGGKALATAMPETAHRIRADITGAVPYGLAAMRGSYAPGLAQPLEFDVERVRQRQAGGLAPSAAPSMTGIKPEIQYTPRQLVSLNKAKERYEKLETEHREWLNKHPELQPDPGFELDFTQWNDPRLEGKHGQFIAYRLINDLTPTLAAMGAGTVTAILTGNPIAGAMVSAAVFAPLEHKDVFDSVLKAGGKPEDATMLANIATPMIAGVETLGNYIAIDKLTGGTFSKFVKGELRNNMGKVLLSSLMAKGLVDFLQVEAGETLEEVVQQIISNAAVKFVNNNQKMFEGIPQTAINTLITTIPIAGAGAGTQFTRGVREAERQGVPIGEQAKAMLRDETGTAFGRKPDAVQKFLDTPSEDIITTPREVVEALEQRGFTRDYITEKMSKDEMKAALREEVPAMPEVTREFPVGWDVRVNPADPNLGKGRAVVDYKNKTITFRNQEMLSDPYVRNHEIAHIKLREMSNAARISLLQDYAETINFERSEWNKVEERFTQSYGQYAQDASKLSIKERAFFEKNYPQPLIPKAQEGMPEAGAQLTMEGTTQPVTLEQRVEPPVTEQPPPAPPQPPVEPVVTRPVTEEDGEPVWSLGEFRSAIQEIEQRGESSTQEIQSLKDRLTGFMKEKLPVSEQGKFISQVNNVRTTAQLLKAMDSVSKVAEEYDKSQIRKSIYKELASVKTRKVAGMVKGKFTADIQKKLDVIRKATQMNHDAVASEFLRIDEAVRSGELTLDEADERRILLRMGDIKYQNTQKLNETLTAINEFKQTGKLARLIEMQLARRERIGYSTIEDAVTDLSNQLPPRKPRTTLTEKKPSRWSKLLTIGNLFDRIEREFMRLDGYDYNGKLSNVFWKSVNKSTSDELRGISSRMDDFRAFIKTENINLSKLLTEKVYAPYGKITKAERIGFYLHSLNTDNRYHLQMGYTLSDAQIEEVTKFLTADEMKIAKYLQNYFETEYESINKTKELLDGVGLNKVDDYFPIRIRKDTPEGTIDLSQSIADEDLLRSYPLSPASRISKDFTKERVHRAGQAIKLDAYELFTRHLQEVEHYKAFAPLMRDLQTILKSADFRTSLVAHDGVDTYKQIDTWLKQVAQSDPYGVYTEAETWARAMRSNGTLAVLGVNITVGMRQSVSYFNGMAEIGEIPALRGLVLHLADYNTTKKLIKEYSPQMRQRVMEREIAEIQAGRGVEGKIRPRELFMLLTTGIDRLTCDTLWRGAFDDYLGKHPGQVQAAADYATDAIRRTQPWFSVKDVAEAYRSGEAMRWLTMFTNQLNQNYNYIKFDIFGKAGAGKISKAQAVRKMIEVWAIPALILGMIARGRPLQDWGEAIKSLAGQAFAPLPIIGSLISSALNGYQFSGIVPTEVLESIQGGILSGVKGDWEKVLTRSLETVGYGTGIPVRPGKRWIDGIVAVANAQEQWWLDFMYGTSKAEKIREEKGVFDVEGLNLGRLRELEEQLLNR